MIKPNLTADGLEKQLIDAPEAKSKPISFYVIYERGETVTKVIAENNDVWTLKKIRSWVDLETAILNKEIGNVESKLKAFENRYGNLDREVLYGQVDDMELLEWEGEIETMKRLREKLTRINQIVFENE